MLSLPCTTYNSNPPLALSCSQACLDRQHASPHDDTRAHVWHTLQSPSSEGLNAYRVFDLACSLFPSPVPEHIIPALPTLASSFPLNPYRNVPYEPFPVDPSHPSMFPSPFCLDSNHNSTPTPHPTPQHRFPPHPQPKPHPPVKPPSQPSISSRFAHPNRFQALSPTSQSIPPCLATTRHVNTTPTAIPPPPCPC